MGLGWKEWTRSDIIYGVIVPLVVVLVIVGLSLVSSFLMSGGRSAMSGSSGIVIGIISAIEELVLTVAVPLLLGLVWNRWAGGASGFLMGSIWSMWYAVKYGLYSGFVGGQSARAFNLGPTLLGWVLSAMLIGYMAGALNKHSENLRRMLIVGMGTTAVGGFFLLGMFQLSPSNVVPFDFTGFALNVATRIAAGALVAIIAKVFMWYGVTSTRYTTSNVWGRQMDYPPCSRKTCMHPKEGRCSLKNPEQIGVACLDFEDAMDSLRLKADAIKGTLDKSELNNK